MGLCRCVVDAVVSDGETTASNVQHTGTFAADTMLDPVWTQPRNAPLMFQHQNLLLFRCVLCALQSFHRVCSASAGVPSTCPMPLSGFPPLRVQVLFLPFFFTKSPISVSTTNYSSSTRLPSFDSEIPFSLLFVIFLSDSSESRQSMTWRNFNYLNLSQVSS